MTTEEMTKLGLEMAAKCHWSKEAILRVAADALEDANFHPEALDVLAIGNYEPEA